ncbi:MAG: hypothetical protein AAGD96_25620 [Chloroflexota bacterium]
MPKKVTDYFWTVVEPMLVDEALSKGRLMAYPCVRVNGNWFAAAHHITGDLVVKLPESRVQEIIEFGQGKSSWSGGRRFKERVIISERDRVFWIRLIREARTYVENSAHKKNQVRRWLY